MRAFAIQNSVKVVMVEKLPDAKKVLIVDCADYDAYKSLPVGVSFDGTMYGLTGWNSDRGHGYYREGAALALGVN